MLNPQQVEITSLYFRRKANQEKFDSYPKRMIFEGREYNFIEPGMQYLIRTGQKIIKLFDTSDGQMSFRLRLENNDWTLISIKNKASA